MADGTVCTDGGPDICLGGSCVAGCVIDGGAVADGQANPSDGCQTCAPAQAFAEWTSLNDGAPCADGGLVCFGGSCSDGCIIDGGLIDADQGDPTNVCQICEPQVNALAWSNLPDGTSCSACNSCSSGACGPTLIAGGVSNPGGIYLDDGYVFWTDVYGKTVNQAYADGGGSFPMLSSGLVSPGPIVANSTTVYAADFGGKVIYAIPVGATAGTDFVPFIRATSALAIDSNNLYWADLGRFNSGFPGHVQSQALSGGYGDGGYFTYVTGDSPAGVAVDSSSIWWIDSTLAEVLYAPIDGGAPTSLTSTEGAPVAMTADAVNVYWTTADGGVFQASKTTGTVTLLASDQADANAIATDGVNVYFTDFNGGFSQGGSLNRVPVNGGSATTLYGGYSPSQVQVDNQCVYWGVFGGPHAILKTDK